MPIHREATAPEREVLLQVVRVIDGSLVRVRRVFGGVLDGVQLTLRSWELSLDPAFRARAGTARECLANDKQVSARELLDQWLESKPAK